MADTRSDGFRSEVRSLLIEVSAYRLYPQDKVLASGSGSKLNARNAVQSVRNVENVVIESPGLQTRFDVL